MGRKRTEIIIETERVLIISRRPGDSNPRRDPAEKLVPALPANVSDEEQERSGEPVGGRGDDNE